MAAVPAKRADLVEIAHPGFKVVYQRTTDKAGKDIVVPHTMPDIDANDAVTRFPDMYSYARPNDVELQPAVGAHNPYDPAPAVPGEPSAVASQAVGGADTSVGHGTPASPPAQAGTASAAVSARAAADNERAVADAKATDGKDVTKK